MLGPHLNLAKNLMKNFKIAPKLIIKASGRRDENFGIDEGRCLQIPPYYKITDRQGVFTVLPLKAQMKIMIR